MPPKKYVDFRVSEPFERMSKYNTTSTSDVRKYVGITCPYCCVVFVNIPSEHVFTNKASECKKHLLKCSRAADDGVAVEPIKRKGERQESKNSDEATNRDQISTLVASEAKLLSRNEDLRSQVSLLNEQMANLQDRDTQRAEENKELRTEMAHLKSNMEHMYRLFSHELGLPERPPWPSVEEYTDRLLGLKKAAAVNEGVDQRDKQPSLKRTREENEKLKTENKQLRKQRAVSAAFTALVRDDRFHRQTMLLLHPDKRGQLAEHHRPHADVLLKAVQTAR